MAWTYDATLAAEKDQVRFLIQDNNTNRQLFQDEEIDWTISKEANVYMAAAVLCEQLVSKAGGIKGKKISEFAIQYDPAMYHTMAATLRARGYGHQVPFAGGISIAQKNAQFANTDAVQPAIVRNLDDNPAAPKPEVPPADPLGTV